MTNGCSCDRKCLCGKNAVAVAYLPTGNIYGSDSKMITEPTNVCDYHAEKSRKLGYTVNKY